MGRCTYVPRLTQTSGRRLDQNYPRTTKIFINVIITTHQNAFTLYIIIIITTIILPIMSHAPRLLPHIAACIEMFMSRFLIGLSKILDEFFNCTFSFLFFFFKNRTFFFIVHIFNSCVDFRNPCRLKPQPLAS